MSMTQAQDVLKGETLQQQFAQLQEYVRRSAKEGRPEAMNSFAICQPAFRRR
jgi:hypothetical protein